MPRRPFRDIEETDRSRRHEEPSAPELTDAGPRAGVGPGQLPAILRTEAAEKGAHEFADVAGVAALFGVEPQITFGLGDLPLESGPVVEVDGRDVDADVSEDLLHVEIPQIGQLVLPFVLLPAAQH